MKLGFITSQNPEECSGGQSSISYSIYKELEKYFECKRYYIPLPNELWNEKLLSRLLRHIGLKGKLSCFSDRRLNNINKEFQYYTQYDDSDFFFFNSMTQWINITPKKPYFIYNDICFSTYKNIYFESSNFQVRDLKRIQNNEAKWLNNAKGVFFRSEWACKSCIKDYKISGVNIYNVGRGANCKIPKMDVWDNQKNLLFISREFIPKGGIICFEAFKEIYKYSQEFRLMIIGQKPPDYILDHPGVIYYGWINRTTKEGQDKFTEILSHAMFLIHPTFKDANPLVITEAGYFGCPSITVKSFAIPELVSNGLNGILLDANPSPRIIASQILELDKDYNSYKKMRNEVRKYNINFNTWEYVGKKIANIINEVINIQTLNENINEN